QFQEDPPEDPPEVPMADNRTMAELLQAPTEGYEDAIVIPEIAANNFELKHGLINLVQNKQFFRHDKEDMHAHIHYFNKITSMMRFFPPSKTTYLRNEITRFQQRFDESFYEAWDRFNDLLRACRHHGFSELHPLDTFYNALNVNDQDSLNSTAGGNFLDKMPRECLKIIESKSKVRQSRAKEVLAKVSTSSSTPAISPKVAELKDMVRALLLDKKTNPQLQLILLLLLQLKQSSQIVLLAMVLTRTKIVPLPTETFIETTSKSGNFNQGQLHRHQVNQPPAYQAPAYQAHIPQTQSVSQTDFKSYIKANDAVLRNMQNQGQNVQNQCQGLQTQIANLTDMLSKFVSSNTASSSGSGTLPSNTITNPKEDLKGITTQSGVAYQRPIIPTPSKVVKQGTEEKLSEMARTPMNEHCSAVILNKLARKLGDSDKFLIPCELQGMDECLALANLISCHFPCGKDFYFQNLLRLA
nr:hypothetical protein [Tanacetum cinerariifolium]